jgi:tetratricopeptide (TPR) repeat protein
MYFVIVVASMTMFVTSHAQTYRIDSLRNALSTAAHDTRRVDLLNVLAGELMRTTVLQESEDFANEALRSARDMGYALGVAQAFDVLTLINLAKGEYTLAMQYGFRALKYYEELESKQGRARVLTTMGLIMIEEREFGRAHDFARQSRQIFRALKDSMGSAHAALVMAEYQASQNKVKTAKAIASQASKTFQDHNFPEGMVHAWYRLGNFSMMEKDYDSAKFYYRRAATKAEARHHVALLININTAFAEMFLSIAQRDSAYGILRKTLSLAVRNQYRNNELEIYHILTEYFRSANKFDSVLHYTQVASSLEHELFDRQKRDQMITLQMLSNFEERDQEIAFHKRIVRRQYIAITGVTLILLLSVIFGFRIYALNKSNIEAKEALLALNAEKNRINENLESIVIARTDELKDQNQKILDYAFTIAHEVRGPLARILGLIELAKIRELDDDDKKQIMVRLEDASNELDDIIRSINRKLESAKR